MTTQKKSPDTRLKETLAALDKLTDREVFVLFRRGVYRETYETIGQQIDRTRTRARNLYLHAVNSLPDPTLAGLIIRDYIARRPAVNDPEQLMKRHVSKLN